MVDAPSASVVMMPAARHGGAYGEKAADTGDIPAKRSFQVCATHRGSACVDASVWQEEIF